MKYLFLLHDDEDQWDAMPEAERNKVYGAYVAYTDNTREAGVFVGGAPLPHSREAKRVRASSKTTIQDGPFADGKEQLGGYYMIEAKNLDEALDWAARCPCASYGWVEVRPVLEVRK
jgi:hypothetical protein